MVVHIADVQIPIFAIEHLSDNNIFVFLVEIFLKGPSSEYFEQISCEGSAYHINENFTFAAGTCYLLKLLNLSFCLA